MKTKSFFGGILCLCAAGILFYALESVEKNSFASMLLIFLLLAVGAYNIIPRKRKPFEEQEETLEAEFASFKEFIGEEIFQGRTGGYFAEKSTIAMESFFPSVIPVGLIPQEKKEKYLFLVKEKANRILSTFRSLCYISSYESRDTSFIFPENNQAWGKWGGALVIDEFFTIYSFSGFPELLDEAFICWVAWHRKTMTLKNLTVICERRSDNPYLQKILDYAVKQ